jgi:hypothetical protein
MDWFKHNFIADMPGPQFLLLYAGVILSVLVLCRVRLRLSDPSAALPPPTIPQSYAVKGTSAVRHSPVCFCKVSAFDPAAATFVLQRRNVFLLLWI